MSAAPARVLAPAKVNLTLAVLGRRPDGYHEVETTLLALDLWDRIEARPLDGEGVELEVHGPAASADIPTGQGNLVFRAAEQLLERARGLGLSPPGRGVGLRLEKHIPSQAGLGGASSDAAAAVIAVQQALGFELPAAELLALLAGLGSDCAFFHAAPTGLARCRGRGEQVEALPPAPAAWRVVLLAPAEGASTAAVYAEHARVPQAPHPRAPSKGLLDLPEAEARERLFNDLEAPALRAVPALGAWRRLLDGSGCAHFRLAGSGSSFFGLYTDAGRAAADLEQLRARVRELGLRLRGSWILAPAGSGARKSAP